MDGIQSARVIAFRRPGKVGPVAPAAVDQVGADEAGADEAGDRLRRALQALEQAVAGQRAAVAQWRGALGTLGGSMGMLQATMQGYDAQLGALRGRVDAVTADAKRLEAWADAAAAVAGKMSQEK